MIEIKNISKQFRTKNGNTINALTDISFSVKKGEIFGIIGSSGAGKSTLLRCINLLENPTRGEVEINEIDLTKLSDAQLQKMRRKIGMIFQHFNLLSSRTVAENIALPLELVGHHKKEIAQRVNHLLKLVGLQEKSQEYPSNLSGGQKQRIAIARALATEPEILLCDEATSALDPNTTKSILRLLQKINRELGLTIVLITHEIQVVKEICNKIALIENGRIIETGTREQIFVHPKDPFTKQFVQSAIQAEIPIQFQNFTNLNNGSARSKLVRFQSYQAEILLTKELHEKFGVKAHVIDARIETIGTLTLSSFLILIEGDRLEDALTHLNSLFQNLEVINND